MGEYYHDLNVDKSEGERETERGGRKSVDEEEEEDIHEWTGAASVIICWDPHLPLEEEEKAEAR